MTQKELLSLEHLKIAEVKPNLFLHVHAEDGWHITSWNEGDKIEDYWGCQCIYAPIKDEYPDYRMIESMEHLKNEDQKRIELERIRLQGVTGAYVANK